MWLGNNQVYHTFEKHGDYAFLKQDEGDG